METEIWKPVQEYESYFVSSLGNIASMKSGERKILKLSFSGKVGKQYYKIALWKDGIPKYITVHRLVSIHFLESIPGKDIVNHKNGNKLDNTVDNLEWCTCSENIRHAYETGLNHLSEVMINNSKNIKITNTGKFGEYHQATKIVHQFTLDGNFIKSWYGTADIKRILGFNNGNISSCCSGRQKTAYGFIWRHELSL